MKPRTNHEARLGAVDHILAGEEELTPSSGFLSATMERVHEEAASPEPIPFPWLRALPGIVLVVAVLGWCGFEVVSVGLANAREISLAQVHVSAATWSALEPAGWVALALGASMLSWIFARRLAGRSGLL